MLPYEDFSTLPLLYHLNSEPWLNVEAYNDPAAEVRFKDMSGEGSVVPLPPVVGDSALRTLLRARRSCREYAVTGLALEAVSSLLEGAYGGVEVAPLPNGQLGLRRPVPSAGGLYPLELYVAASAINGIVDGVYHYHALHHRLEAVTPRGALSDLGRHLLAQYYLSNASLVVFIAAVFERCLRKYGPRGYRYVLLEAGHVAQNLCLLAAERGLGSLCVGGFRDAPLNRLIGLDGVNEAVVYCVGVGHAAPVES